MQRKVSIFLCILMLWTSLPSYGMSIYARSLEWLVDSSPVVLLIKNVFSSSKNAEKRGVQIVQIFKSERSPNSPELNPSYPCFRKIQNNSQGDEILLFLRKTNDGHFGIFQEINLSKPSPFFPITKNLRVLHDKEEILSLVSERVKLKKFSHINLEERREANGPMLGFLIISTNYLENVSLDSTAYIIVPPDEEFREKTFTRALKAPYSSRAISSLANYPNPTVLQFLKERLMDTQEGGSGFGIYREKRKRPFFPVRQAAYDALIFLGEKIPKPDWYDDEMPKCFY